MASLNWPQNLWEDLTDNLPFRIESKEEQEKPSTLFLPNLDSILDSAMDERHQKVIRMRYEQGLTYREIGEMLGVSDKRVGQMRSEALRKLREPKYYLQLSAVPKIEVRRLQSEIESLKHQNREQEQQIQLLSSKIESAEAERIREQMKKPLTTPIGSLNLTVRSYNVLVAHGITTIGELLECTKSSLSQFRNLGKRSVADIERTLNAYGYELKQEECGN